MREYSYLYNTDGIQIKGLLKQYYKEIELLQKIYSDKEIYKIFLKKLNKFQEKYPNINETLHKINEDKISPYAVNYYYANNKWPSDTSPIGIEFEKDLNELFKLEEEVTKEAAKEWKKKLNTFEEIENGKEFMIVGHSSWKLPGTPNNPNYKNHLYGKKYLSCSLFSNRVLDTFNDYKVVYIIPVNEENYIASSPIDCVTKSTGPYNLNNLLKTNDDPKLYINVGYSYNIESAVTGMMTPEIIEQLTVDRNIKECGEILNDKHYLTNEIVLNRDKCYEIGILLISNGCDLLLYEYNFIRNNNLPIKCINKGIYRRQNNLSEYTEKEYKEFKEKIENLDLNKYNIDFLEDYYKNVIIPMQYETSIQQILELKFSEVINIKSDKTTNKEVKK